jgi:riboflavin-specific deaminase-like protein
MSNHREMPFVFINMAMTADGKISSANRALSSFGSKRDLEHLYELRATADAVMAGARTAEVIDLKMGPGGHRFERRRLRNGLARYNLRIIVTGSGSVDPSASVFQHRFSPIIVVTSDRISASRRAALGRVADEVLVAGGREIDFAFAFRHLRRQWKVRRLLSEGGGELNDAIFRAGLVDELHLTVCPKIFGGRTAPTIVDGRGFPRLSQAALMRLKSMRRIRTEVFLVYRCLKQSRSTSAPHR